MNPLQLIATASLMVAFGWGSWVWKRGRDWRSGLVFVLLPGLGLLHAAQVLSRSNIWPLTFESTTTQVTASVVAVLISASIVVMGQIVDRQRQVVSKAIESEDRYRTLFECSPIGIGLADSEGRLLAFNEAMLAPGGYEEGDIVALGSNVAALYYDPADRVAVLEELRRSGFVRDAEVRFKRVDGSPYLTSMSLVPLQGRSQILAIVQDISKRKESEAALRASETFLRLSQQVGQIGSWEWNLVTNHVRWSSEMYRIHATDPDEFANVPEDYVRFVHPDDRARVEQAIADLLEGRSYSLEYRILHSSGEERFVMGTSGIVRGEDGTPASVVGTVHDITERKSMENALRASEHRFRTLAQATREGILIHDRGIILEANDAAAHLMGLDPGAIVGTNGLDHLTEDTRKRVIHHMAQGEAFEGAGVMRRLDGSTFEAEFLATPVKYRGRPARALAFRDVTARNEADRSLRESRQRLRNFAAKLEEAREDERGALSRELHDQLGQTLTGLKMDVAGLSAHVAANPEAGQRLRSINGLLDGMVETVRDLSSRLRPGVLDDLGLVATIDWQVREFTRRSGIDCLVELPDEGIELAPELGTAVFRILQEALTNVARHSAATHVEIKLAVDKQKLTLTVNDDGIGVPDHALSAPDSIGLIGMQERAGGLGGRVRVKRINARGTSVQLSIPRS